MKKIYKILFLVLPILLFSQKTEENSKTRKFLDVAEFTQINKDWNIIANFKSGIGEEVSFFPVEAINLKSNQRMKSLQMDMDIKYDFMGKSRSYFKSSWIDLDEIDEFITFLEQYVVPNLKDKTDKKQSTSYVFNSREMSFKFHIEKNTKRISVYLKDYGSIDNEHYFWTETQVNKIPELLEMLKQIK